jgi:hypothetical protein
MTETDDMSNPATPLSEWLTSVIAERGWKLFGDVELVKQRPWATVITANTSAGRVYAKANCDGLRSEAALLALLADWVPNAVIAPIAVNQSTGWLAVLDGGQTLYALGLHSDPELWAPVLANVAEAQKATVGRTQELISVGVPDFRPSTVGLRLEQLVVDLDLVGVQRRRVLGFATQLETAAAELDSGPIGSAISHGDLQPNNMLAPPTSKPFDWGDAVVTHPFCTLTSLRWSVDDVDLYGVLRSSYLSHWSDHGPPAELNRLADLAQLVGCVASIWTWVRVGPAAIKVHPKSIPTWFDRIENGLTSV